MSVDDIIKQIDEEIIHLNDLTSKPNKITDFFENFLANSHFQGIENIINIDLSNLFIATLLSKCENISYYELEKIVHNNSDIFDNSQSESEFLDKYYKISKAAFPNGTIDMISIAFGGLTKDFCDFSNIVARYPKETSMALSIVGNIISLKEKIDNLKDFTEHNMNSSMAKKIKNNYVKRINISELVGIISEVQDYCYSTILQDKSMRKKAVKEMTNYKKIKLWLLEKLTSSDPIEINKELCKISDPEIKLSILKEIYTHNLSICKETESKYIYLVNNSKNRYKKVLSEHGILLDDKQINFNMSVDDLDESLNILGKAGFSYNEDIIKILKLTDKERVANIVSLVNSGFIKKSLVESKIDLFDKENELYCILSQNIKMLKENMISFTTISDMGEVLFSKSLSSSINVINDYFTSCQVLRSSNSYEFMKNKNEMIQKINIMIELGYYDNLLQDIDLLNYPIDSYKKLIILKRINLLPESSDDIILVLENSLINRNEELNDFLLDMRKYPVLEDTTINKQQFLEKLDSVNSMKSELNCYHFGNILISKVKVKNELEKYKDTLTSLDQFSIITKDKIIDSSEYSTIKNLIESSTVDKKVFQKS